MEIRKIEQERDIEQAGITPVWVEAVLMPNGEVISKGQAIGFIDKEDFKEFTWIQDDD